MTEFTREYGQYGSAPVAKMPPRVYDGTPVERPPQAFSADNRAGVCIPWEEQVSDMPPITGNMELAKRIWEEIDGLGYVFIWHCLLSF